MVRLVQEVDYDISENTIKDISKLTGIKGNQAFRKEVNKFLEFIRGENFDNQNDLRNKFQRELRQAVEEAGKSTEGVSSQMSQFGAILNKIKVENLRGNKISPAQLTSTVKLKTGKQGRFLFNVKNMQMINLGELEKAREAAEKYEESGEPPEGLEIAIHNVKLLYAYIKEEKDDFGESKEKPKDRVGRYRTTYTEEKQGVDIPPLDFNFIYGAVDASKGAYRKIIYEHWSETAKKYTIFKEKFDAFAQELVKKENKVPDKLVFDFEKFFKRYRNKNLEYIGKFESYNSTHDEPVTRFGNLIDAWMATNNIMEKERENQEERGLGERDADMSAEELRQVQEQERDEVSGSEVGEQQIMAGSKRALSAIAQSESGELVENIVGDTLDSDEEEIGKKLTEYLDPLLAWELKRNTKLVALTTKQHNELRDYIYDFLDEAADNTTDLIIQPTTKHKINQWADEIDDSLRLEKEDLKNNMFALPISVLDNKEFMEMYRQGVKGAITDEKLDDDVDTTIKEFFNDLYEVLRLKTKKVEREYTEDDDIPEGAKAGDKYEKDEVQESFAFHVANRSTKGQPKGSAPIDWVEAVRANKLGLVSAQGSRASDRGFADINEDYKKLTKSLQEFLEASMDYFISPLQAGLLVVSAPTFMNGVGSRGIDAWAKEIGLENVFGSSWEKMARGSAKEISAGALEDIADFLSYREDKQVEIDNSLFTTGTKALRALVEIFGKEAEDDIANELGMIIFVLMNEIDDFARFKKRFPRRGSKTIEDRVKGYMGSVGKRRYLVALVNYLEVNQGALSESDKKKIHYDKIMDFFAQKQQDIPFQVKKLLKAHDIIRKQLGKKVVYGFLNLEKNFDSFLDKMYHEERVDLSHLEVENIVKSDDSHSNLSKEYGISSEQVYLIKANFRA